MKDEYTNSAGKARRRQIVSVRKQIESTFNNINTAIYTDAPSLVINTWQSRLNQLEIDLDCLEVIENHVNEVKHRV